MSVFKVISITLLIALVLGGFYVVTLFGPGRVQEQNFSYVDPLLEGDQLLKESERCEKEFERAASANAVSEEAISSLRKAIAYQEQYIDKAQTMNRAPAERLMKLQTRLHNVESAPLAEAIDQLAKKAIIAETDAQFKSAIDYYRQAYDLQSKINTDYPLSKYKNIGRRVEFDRQVKMLEARPLYLSTVALEKKAREALDKKDFLAAKEMFEKTLEAIAQLHATYPASVYTDFARLMKLETELASLQSGGLAEKIADYKKKAVEAEKNGEYLVASEAYSDAAENQRNLNRLYPKSAYVSEENLKEFERKKIETYSWKFAKEIKEQDKVLLKALRAGDTNGISETSSNLLRKAEHFTQNFPQSNLLDGEIIMRLRYINFMAHDIAKIQKIILSSLGAVDSSARKMMKTEVTQELYSIVMQENPSRFTDDKKRPVDSVTLDDVKRFCNRVNWILGYSVSIPDEQMYRNAIGSLRYADINEISWNNMNSGGTTHPVASKKPNDKGFYDLLGNVAEYVMPASDVNFDSISIIGGGAQTSADVMSDIPISKIDPKQRNRMVGFRIVVDLSVKEVK